MRSCSPTPASSPVAARRPNPQALDDLRAFDGVEVVAARMVDDGDVLTAGAPSCGIDLGLRILERERGAQAATAAAREVGYEELRPAADR